MSVQGKRVLITGASGGFGMATARALIAAGARVVGVDLELPAQGAGFPIYQADVRSDGDVSAAVTKAVEELGGLDVLINNAGINGIEDPGHWPSQLSLRKLDTNFFGTWRVTAAALPALLESHGRVVNVASVGAYVVLPFLPAYSGSKRAVAAYSDVLRSHYRGRIDVTTVYPSYMKTAIHDHEEGQGLWPERLYSYRLGRFKLFTWEEEVESAARAMVRICGSRPRRDTALTFRGALTLFLARHFPAITERQMLSRLKKMQSLGMQVRLE